MFVEGLTSVLTPVISKEENPEFSWWVALLATVEFSICGVSAQKVPEFGFGGRSDQPTTHLGFVGYMAPVGTTQCEGDHRSSLCLCMAVCLCVSGSQSD